MEIKYNVSQEKLNQFSKRNENIDLIEEFLRKQEAENMVLTFENAKQALIKRNNLSALVKRKNYQVKIFLYKNEICLTKK